MPVICDRPRPGSQEAALDQSWRASAPRGAADAEAVKLALLEQTWRWVHDR
jgi:hypothetical protein